jgi:hypothetical protein
MMDAAALLGVKAVCGFVGRNQKLTMDQNLVFFEQVFVPLLKEAKRAASNTASNSARCRAGRSATTSTTTSGTRQACGSRFIASARSTASAISSVCTTILRTRS